MVLGKEDKQNCLKLDAMTCVLFGNLLLKMPPFECFLPMFLKSLVAV